MSINGTRVAVLAALATLASACSSPSEREARPTLRLSPRMASASGGADGSLLVDRDTTRVVRIAQRTTVTLDFGHEVEIRKVKVHGATSLDVSVSGASLGAPDEAGWAEASFSSPVSARELAITLDPAGSEAGLREIEVWGAGRALAPRGIEALAKATAVDEEAAWENAWVLRPDVSAASLQPAGLGEGSPCARVKFPAFEPRQARRAYLAYEANVRRPVSLRHSLNGDAPLDGFWLGTTREAGTHVDELDPATLRGADDLLLCVPEEADATVTLTGLRLLLLLDDGSAVFDRETRQRVGAGVDGDEKTETALGGGATRFLLDRAIDVEVARLRLGRAPATVERLGVFDGTAWREQTGVEFPEPSGELPIRGATSAIDLTFPGPARADVPAASLAELALTGSPVGSRVGSARIVLVYPATTLRDGQEIGERFGPKAFLSGWAESPAGAGAVEIEGARVDVDGAFALPLERALDATGSWEVTLTARFPDGSEVVRTVRLDDDHEDELLGSGDEAGTGTDAQRFGRENQTGWGTIDPVTGGRVTLGTDVAIDAPPGAVSGRTQIGVTRKGGEVIPRLEAGMINVTAPAHGGYRFTPRGQKFAKPVKVTLPYDPDLLPEGVAPEEIQTYYFDEQQDRWFSLQRKAVLRARRQIESETTHFTFMINAVLVLPDHPGPVSFNPNSIKDLKAADPSAGIDLIEPPQGNNQGTARLSFPMRLPKARGAYQPSLGISYDSTAGNGWVGVGWDLATPRVSIDTRYGVPDYGGQERYLLDGQQIVPFDPLSPEDPAAPPPLPLTCLDGSAAREYHARVEGSFLDIRRCGADPTRYWFQVIDKAGTLYVYGRSENARLTSYLPRVTDPPSFPQVFDVAEWYLERVVDANRNLTQYFYQHDSAAAGESVHREPFRQVYPRSIQYSGTATSRTGAGALEGGSAGPYLVEFMHQPGTRADEVTSARTGFKTVLRRRLGSVAISLLSGAPSGLIRKYDLEYERGDLGKTRLKRAVVRGTGEEVFYAHSFEYENRAPDEDEVTLFGAPVTWHLGAPSQSGLSASDEWAFGFHGFVGFGASFRKGDATVGVGFGYGQRRSTTKVAFVDVNGDGLPDRISDSGWIDELFGESSAGVLFNRGSSRALTAAPPEWDPAAPLGGTVATGLGSKKLAKDVGQSVDAALQIFVGPLSANFGAAYNLSKSEDFIVDANGDGLPDLVSKGAVYFNQTRATTCTTTDDELCCPAGSFCFSEGLKTQDSVVDDMPALEELGDSAPLVANDATLSEAGDAMDEALTPEDAVIEWTAPYDGVVDVSGALQFAHPTAAGERRDGVRLRVYTYDPFTPEAEPVLIPAGTILKTPGDATATPLRLGGVAVERGHLLYFVLSTLTEFPMRDGEGALSPIEQVSFAPVIAYRGRAAEDRELKDPTGAYLYRFDAKQDFVLAGQPQGSISLPSDGRLALTARLTKKASSDDVRVCVQYYPPPADDSTDEKIESKPCGQDPGATDGKGDIYSQTLGWSATAQEVTIALPTRDVAAGGTLFVRVDTDLAIDPRAVAFRVSGSYECVSTPDGCLPPEGEEVAKLAFDAMTYAPLHENVSRDAEVWEPPPSELRPFVATKSGTLLCSSHADHVPADPPVFFSIRTLDAKVMKETGAHGGLMLNPWTADPSDFPYSVALEPGDQVFFEAHSDSPASLEGIRIHLGGILIPLEWLVTCRFDGADGSHQPLMTSGYRSTDRHSVGWTEGNQPSLSGGYHGWRYGSWNGREGEPFQPWVYRGEPKSNSDANWEDADAVTGQKDSMKDPEDRKRVRLRLLGLLVPSNFGTRIQGDQDGFEPTGAAYVSQDGNTYFTAGHIHAGKKGESASDQANDPEGDAVSRVVMSIGKAGRSSAAVSVSAGLSVGVGTVSLGGGMGAGISQQKVDLADMNGDGFVDVIASGGIPSILRLNFSALGKVIDEDVRSHVRMTSPSSLTTVRTLHVPGAPMLSLDMQGQFNVGLTGAIPDLKPTAEKPSVKAHFPGFGGGAAFSVSTVVQQIVDMNGDGLGDMVRRSTSGGCAGVWVRLNMGTSFASTEDCVEAEPSDLTEDSFLDAMDTADSDDGDTNRSAGVVTGMMGVGPIRRSKTITVQGNAGGGLLAVTASKLKGGHPSSESWGFSVSAESSIATTNVAMVDVTGDGLPDYVSKSNAGSHFIVRVNTGFGFAPARAWRPADEWGAAQKPRIQLAINSDGNVGKLLKKFIGHDNILSGVDPLEATGSHSILPNVGVSANFAWPIWGVVPAPPYIHIGAGTSLTPRRVTGFELGLQDIDGDGLADHVLKSSDGQHVWARLNQLGKANLLKKVVRPLGGSIDLAYEQRLGNTVEMPGSRWVLTSVTARDGRAPTPGAAGHDLETKWSYANGRHERYEREFLGFETVTRKNPDGTTVEQAFETSNFVWKGLLVSEKMRDADGRLWVETVNSWSAPVGQIEPSAACKAVTPAKLPKLDYCGSFFTKLDGVVKRFHEGEAQPGIVTRQRFAYDSKGDVVAFADDGDVADPNDDIVATIVYANDTAKTTLGSVSRPELVTVTDPGGATLRKRKAEYFDDGNLKAFWATVAPGVTAETKLTWNDNGTLDSVEGPPNARDQRYKTTYGYDGITGTYVAAITDSHGYESTATYDLRFGEPTTTFDLNGNRTLRKLDAFGRLERLAGPNDTLDAPTVWISYSHAAGVPWARTKNRLPRQEGDTRGTVDTVVLMDGLGRVIQTKKTAELATSATSKGLGWSITGHQVFDAMGRVEQQGQTFGQFSQRPEYVDGAPRNPTRFFYDVLGRMIQTVEPNNAITRVRYGFGKHAQSSLTRFMTVTTDAEGHSKAAYKDAGDRIVAVEERIDGRAPTTRYEYSRTGEMTKVIDAGGNVTTVGYDQLGRRTSLQNPDTGLIRYELDRPGNVVRKYDPNLDAAHQFIEYVYDQDQLTDIKYPDPRRNVHYTYGASGSDSDRNGVGRVIEVEDEAGKELRYYGKLGEVTKTTRILRPVLPGDSERTFTTGFSFDAFGRMMSITYPDGETVKYGYDAGGLLEKAVGHRTLGGVNQAETYLASLLYDEFGQRVRMVLGNGSWSSYTYEPLTRRLSNLQTQTPSGRILQNIGYGYDRVGNIVTMVNGIGYPIDDRSGTTSFQYRYDDLYRLTWASGEAKARAQTIDRFTAQYSYSDIHNMTSNVQIHEIVHGDVGGVTVDRPPKTNHEFAYTYSNPAPHQATRIGETLLVYDGNGNTVKECRDHGSATCDVSADKLRTFSWTEENRLEKVVDGGGKNVTRFIYDAGGDRVVKLGRGGESITIGQFWSLKGRRAATKHIFAGSTRLASKLLPPPGWTSTTPTLQVPTTGTATNPVGDGLPNDTGCEPASYNPQKCPVLAGGTPVVNHYFDDTTVRPETYYYHPDHLGSTSWVTDQSARVHEHVEYFPYGEVWRDPRNDSDGGPVKGQRFLFTGKELDEETGLVYFGARYYEPRWARWLGVDPALGDFVDQGGRGDGPLRRHIFVPASLSLFSHANQNPIVLKDPDGRWVPLLLLAIPLLFLEHDEPGGSDTAMAVACAMNAPCAAGVGTLFVGKGYEGLYGSLEAYSDGDYVLAKQRAQEAEANLATLIFKRQGTMR